MPLTISAPPIFGFSTEAGVHKLTDFCNFVHEKVCHEYDDLSQYDRELDENVEISTNQSIEQTCVNSSYDGKRDFDNWLSEPTINMGSNELETSVI